MFAVFLIWIGATNFIQCTAELWRHVDLQGGGRQPYWISCGWY